VSLIKVVKDILWPRMFDVDQEWRLQCF